MDLTAALVNQSTRAFSVALECHVALANIQTRNKTLVHKLAFVKEKIKKLRAAAEAVKAEKIEDIAKLDSTLVEIEALKREVHKSQCEVANLTK